MVNVACRALSSPRSEKNLAAPKCSDASVPPARRYRHIRLRGYGAAKKSEQRSQASLLSLLLCRVLTGSISQGRT